MLLQSDLNFGIQQWIPRKFQHPWYDAHDLVVDIYPAIYAARCMAIMPHSADLDPTITMQANKILTGMLGVLKLQKQQLTVAKVRINAVAHAILQDPAVLWQKIALEIAPWQPEFILVLTKAWQVPLSYNIVQTYDPVVLVAEPNYKQAAYQDLLQLKAKL